MPKSFWIAAVLVSFLVCALAILFRVPSCDESFWLDELHSAWVIADGWDEVSGRAAIGNQTPYYFQTLWLWQRLVGDGEWALRMSSVLATSLAASVLVLGVAGQTQRISAGIIAGGIVAVDPNAVFFGTELRPYAFVMLWAALASWTAMKSMTSETHRGCYRFAMVLSVSLAALIHPTSLGVLGPLACLTLLVAWSARRCSLCRWDVIALVVVFATGWLLFQSSLPESWSRRDQWRAFGVATGRQQLWLAWAWVPLVIVPAGVGLIWIVVTGIRKKTIEDSFVGLIPLVAGLLGTGLFFYASYFDWVPLWHRRYFVASLPLLAWSAGAMATFSLPRNGIGRGVAAVSVVGVLSCLLWYQGTWEILKSGKVPMQRRGEPWREAVAIIQGQRKLGDQVWLDTGLIEASFFRQPMDAIEPKTERQWEYLGFPLRGPYPLEDFRVFAVTEHVSWSKERIEQLNQPDQSIWLLCRYRGWESVRRFLNDLPGRKIALVDGQQLGTLAVVEFRMRGSDEGAE